MAPASSATISSNARDTFGCIDATKSVGKSIRDVSNTNPISGYRSNSEENVANDMAGQSNQKMPRVQEKIMPLSMIE
jgi:hypothetical protein